RVRLRGDASAEQLAAAVTSSLTFAFSEVTGRSYGGGILELEPGEADALPLPDPRLVEPETVTAVDRLLRQGDLDGAVDLVQARLEHATLHLCALVQNRSLAAGSASSRRATARSAGGSYRGPAPAGARVDGPVGCNAPVAPAAGPSTAGVALRRRTAASRPAP